jgi:prefoldin subunit 5
MTNVSSTKWGGERGDIAATANEALEMNTSADVDQLDKMIKQLMKLKAEGEDHLIVLDKRIAQVDKQLRQRHIEITRAEKRIDDYNRAFHDREKEVERMTRRMEQVEDKLKEEKERRGKLMETRAILGRETEAAAAQYKNRMERIKYLAPGSPRSRPRSSGSSTRGKTSSTTSVETLVPSPRLSSPRRTRQSCGTELKHRSSSCPHVRPSTIVRQ